MSFFPELKLLLEKVTISTQSQQQIIALLQSQNQHLQEIKELLKTN